MGRESARTAAATRAVSADPLSPFAHSIAAHAYHYTGAWEDALALHERARSLDANALNALWGAATCLVRLGRAEEALPLFRRAVEISEGAPTMSALLAFGLHAADRAAEARALADELQERFAAHPYAGVIATIRLGDEARLAAALEHAVAMDVAVPSLSTTVRPELDALLGHPRLGPLVRRLNLYACAPGGVVAGG